MLPRQPLFLFHVKQRESPSLDGHVFHVKQESIVVAWIKTTPIGLSDSPLPLLIQPSGD